VRMLVKLLKFLPTLTLAASALPILGCAPIVKKTKSETTTKSYCQPATSAKMGRQGQIFDVSKCMANDAQKLEKAYNQNFKKYARGRITRLKRKLSEITTALRHTEQEIYRTESKTNSPASNTDIY